jgi:bisphosphoglycerate-dependent phosphoglycerate mutase
LRGNYNQRIAKEAFRGDVLKRRIRTNERNYDRDAQAEAEKGEKYGEEHIQQIRDGGIEIRGSVRMEGAVRTLR